MTEDLVAFADFKSVVPLREKREVGSIPTRPRKIALTLTKERTTKTRRAQSEMEGETQLKALRMGMVRTQL